MGTGFPKGQPHLGSLQASREVQSPLRLGLPLASAQPQPRLPSKPLLPLPPSFFTAASSTSLNARCLYCQLCSRWQPVCSLSLQSTNLQSVGFCAGAGPSAHSKLCLHQRRRRRRRKRNRWRMRGGKQRSIVNCPAAAAAANEEPSRCKKLPIIPTDNTLVVVFFNRCNPANYDGGRLAVAKILMIH